MTTTYTSRAGDSVDFIVWKFHGTTTNRMVETVLSANRGLADHGPRLPAGIVITLPEITAPPRAKGVKLWD